MLQTQSDESRIGVLYLLHLEPALKHARHYLGFCTSYHGLDSRLSYHASGRGSRLLRAQSAAGGTWTLVAVWKGTRTDERRLKGCAVGRLCPACRPRPVRPRGLEKIQ